MNEASSPPAHANRPSVGRRPRTTLGRYLILAGAALGTVLWNGACATEPPRATTVTVRPSTAELTALGNTVELTADVQDQNGEAMTGVTVTWASSNSGVAPVNGSGLVTAVANGEATITATAGSASGSAEMTVAQVAGAVTVSPAELEFTALDDTLRLSAEAVDANDHPVGGAVLSWASADASVAAVDSTGLVRSVGNGEAAITAMSGPWSDTAAATVAQKPSSVVVTPSALEFRALEIQQALSAEAKDANGHLVAGMTFVWASSRTEVAEVDESGLVTSVSVGQAVITAVADEVMDSSAVTVVPNPDRAPLVALYEATDGPHWKRNWNWLSDEPLGRWSGVVAVNQEGRVTSIILQSNGLRGRIPPELGELTELETLILTFNRLSGAIPPELGTLAKLKELDLGSNVLDAPLPPELGRLSSLVDLSLYQNRLVGPVPPELGDLANLERLNLAWNRFASPIPKEFGDLSKLWQLHLDVAGFVGEIPPELAKLTKLEWLNLANNDLIGAIPPELGRLTDLRRLVLANTKLTGSIPPEFGELSNLERLLIFRTPLSGPIPPELGQLSNLEYLELSLSRLSGPIPPEFGHLSSLTDMFLYGNALTGEIPAELGQLTELENMLLFRNDLTGSLPPDLADMESLKRLWLSYNDLTGSVPAEFGDFPALDELDLTNNSRMSGPLPVDLKDLGRFNALLAGGTDLCAPSDAAFQRWLRRVPRQRVASCSAGEPPPVYLVQAAQSREWPAPLVADEQALLRVFVTSPNAGGAGIPPVTATFFAEGEEVHVAEIPAKSTPIPKEVDEGDLDKSSNAVIPDSVLLEGLELVVEVDPDSTLPDSITIVRRIPETGRMDLDVVAVPTFNLTAIPFLWTEEPDSAVLDIVAGMARDPESHELLFETRTLLPVGELKVTAHKPVWTSSRSAFSILSQTEAIRVAEGGAGYYQGLLRESTGAAGVAYRPGWSSFSRPSAWIMAHELGHNMSLFHAPCGSAGGPDPAFPQPDGSIGAWGYDFRKGGALVSPKTADVMSYCRPPWISDYHFGSALRYRMWAEGVWEENDLQRRQALLLWGGVDAEEEPFLEPAFVIDAPAALPTRTGDYTLSGHTTDERELFSISFAMADVADGDGSRSFAFALPTRPEWAGRLAAIALEGPGGYAALGLEGDEGMAMLRDPETGSVRGFVRVPEPGLLLRTLALALAAEPRLVIQFSTGIPDGEAWQR